MANTIRSLLSSVSIRLTAAQRTAMETRLSALESLYGPLAAQWPALTPAQRAQVLEHSPLLARLLKLLRPFCQEERW